MQQPTVRHPAVAEEFYPSDAAELESLISGLFDNQTLPNAKANVRAIIAPHAAYIYSGTVSARVYALLAKRKVRTAILMGNAHSYLFNGIAVDPHKAWKTPLGSVPINLELGKRLVAASDGLIQELDLAHHCDHVLEVQVPFLQHQLEPGFSILPILFGKNSPSVHRTVADLLISVMNSDDIIVASSDLSHYPSYRDASKIDRTTMEYLSAMDIDALRRHEKEIRERKIPGAISAFCSPDAVNSLLEIARRMGWTAGDSVYLNSGDIAHDDRLAVVGYGAITFCEI